MPDFRKLMENVHVINGRIHAPHENEPTQYASRKYPYLNVASTRMYQEYAKYASDYFVADAQGLNPNDRTAWEKVTLRMADIVRASNATQRQYDDYKMILLDAMKYAYIPRGAKFVTMGSTWLCTNPENISGSDGMGIIQRCKAVWNHLDWYGNVKSEPMAVEGTEILRANAPDPQYQMPVMKGYYNVKCQYNEDTAQIDDNTRIILGTGCYVVTGYSDFNQEFTGDYDTVRMLEFTIRKDEVNKTIDDMENHVAGGLTFTWEVVVTGPSTVKAGEEIEMSVSSIRCNEPVVSTEEYPIGYLWTSSDESVATIDENGTVTGIADGVCEITATLEQNPEKSTSVMITVAEESTLAWARTPPIALSAYETAVLEATEDAEWIFSGADESAYRATVNGKYATITCWSGSIEPLRVTARANDKEIYAVIPLNGI